MLPNQRNNVKMIFSGRIAFYSKYLFIFGGQLANKVFHDELEDDRSARE